MIDGEDRKISRKLPEFENSKKSSGVKPSDAW